MDQTLEEQVISAWVRLTGLLKNTRITKGMVYNEAIVMLVAYNRYREDGVGMVSFKEIVSERGLLVRCEGKDKRTTFVRILPDNIEGYLQVHEQSLALATKIIGLIGEEDARAFVRISEKVASALKD